MHGIWMFVSAALAQDAVSLEVVKSGQVGTSKPALILHVNQGPADLDVKLDCGGIGASRSGRFAAGEKLELPLDLPAGTRTCKGRLTGVFADGTEGEMPLSFQVTMHPPLG